MANKTTEIDFLGLGNNPSDYDCKDGTLALAVNVLHENGSIENAHYSAPEVKHTYNDADHTVIYQHKILEETLSIFIDKDKNNNYRYFIINQEEGTIYNSLPNVSGKKINDINSIGNTLIFYCEDEIHYYLWKDGQYKWLGTQMPEAEMAFSLTPHNFDYTQETEGDYYYGDGLKVFTPHTYLNGGGGKGKYFSYLDVQAVTEATFATINVFQGDWCAKNGYFSQPFLVRYALRLFDGTHTKHSAPVLMTPATGQNPIVQIVEAHHNADESDEQRYMELNCMGIACSLNYMLKDNSKNIFEDWKDIIKGIDVYVSQPFYTYDSTKEVKQYTMIPWMGSVILGIDDYDTYPISIKLSKEKIYSKNTTGTITGGDFIKPIWEKYKELTWGTDEYNRPACDIVSYEVVSDSSTLRGTTSDNVTVNLAKMTEEGTYSVNRSVIHPLDYIHVPQKANSTLDKEITECSNFYLIKSFDMEDITWSEMTDIEIGEGVISSLVAREALDDDYESHDTLIPNYTRSYNNRINIADLTKTYFQGFYPFSLFQRVVDGETPRHDDIVIRIHLNLLGKDEYVERRGRDIFRYNFIFPYIFYPDTKAYKAEVFTGGKKYTFPMREHKMLNGAYAFVGIDAMRKGEFKHEPCNLNDILDEDPPAPITKYMPNYVYTSEVNNTFKFKAKNVERVGSGRIIAMSPTTLPLSQGQYGYAEMYCFTNDGIWALKVSDTGGWSAKQPFHYDVILNEDRENILQMERDVLFSTDRGLMILAGNSVDCISENFNGRQDVFLSGHAWSQQFGKGWKIALKEKVFPKIWSGDDSLYRDIDYFEDFNKIIGNAVMLYDYTHQRVIIGNPDYSFSFVFSLEDKLWTTIPMKILSSVNSYPNCLANVYDEYNQKNLLVDFTSTDSPMIQPKNGVIITRPIKLNSPSVQKTIRTINLHGQFDKHNTSMILLGCNDNAMTDWFVVSSCEGSRLPFRYGSPFKYFRLVVVTSLDRNESITGASIEFEYKELNKERQ